MIAWLLIAASILAMREGDYDVAMIDGLLAVAASILRLKTGPLTDMWMRGWRKGVYDAQAKRDRDA